jgi:GNAT superfamily N-acetyltransferase
MLLRSARSSERDQVLDLLAEWYHDRDFFARYNCYDPAFRDDLCLIAVEGLKIAATVQIFDRRINLAGESVRLGGIGSVYTSPSRRRQGLASALLKLAAQRMVDEGFELSLLFTDLIAYYRRFGWEEAERQFTPLFNIASIAQPTAPGEIALFDPGRDLDGVMAVYREYSGCRDLTVCRDLRYWQGNLRYAGNPGEYFVVCGTGTQVRAYARAIRFFDYPMVMEYGYRAREQDALVSVLKHLGEVANGSAPGLGSASCPALAPASPAQPIGLLVTHSAHDSELERRLAQAGVTLMHHGDRLYMWRVLMPERVGPRLGVRPEEAQRRLIELASSPQSLYWTSDRF